MKPGIPLVLRATRLLDQFRQRIRYEHYSLRTEAPEWQLVPCIIKRQLYGFELSGCSGFSARGQHQLKST